MQKQIYVIGHRNPDTDSIASAIGYAAFKQMLGQTNVRAAMAGRPNPQTRYILERLGIPAPQYLADVHPKVRDVLGSRPIVVRQDTSLKDSLELFHRHSIRVLPVVDDAGMPVGVVSLLKLSESRATSSSRWRRTTRTGSILPSTSFLSGPKR